MAILRGLCTVAQVEAWTKPSSGTYSATSDPTLTAVEGWIDEAIDEIYAEIEEFGIIVPVVETATKRLVADVNALQAAISIELILHQTVEPNESPYTKLLQAELNRQMEIVKRHAIFPASAINGNRPVIPSAKALYSRMNELWDPDEEDTDGTRGPLFKIGKEF